MRYTNDNILEMLKALSNDTRLEIMGWLVNPEKSFKGLKKHNECGRSIPGWGGVCVGTIQEKSGLCQSTISNYLKIMQQAGLLESRRHEKWTYYRINKDAVKALSSFIDAWN